MAKSVPLTELRKGETVLVRVPTGVETWTGKVEDSGVSGGSLGVPFAHIAPLGYHLAHLIVAPYTVERIRVPEYDPDPPAAPRPVVELSTSMEDSTERAAS
ncbi:MAG: hypothetical protein ABIQ01_04900 [Pseudolysinimonas sp.]